MTYRVGNHQPRNLYRGDQYIGVMFDPADTALIVDVMEGRADTPDVDHTNGAREALAEVAERIADLAQRGGLLTLIALADILEAAAAELGVDEGRDAHARFCDGTCRVSPSACCPATLPPDEEGPARPLSAPVAAENGPARGSGCTEAPAALSGRCRKCGSGLDACTHCGEPALCGEPWCTACQPETPPPGVDIIHLIRDGSAATACCYRTPFDLAALDGHRLTVEPDAVTCGIVTREPERKADQA